MAFALVGPTPASRAGFAHNEHVRFIDILFLVAEANSAAEGAPPTTSKFAHDVRTTVSLCRATAVEERFWSAQTRVRHGQRKRTVLMGAAARGDVARTRWLLARGAPCDPLDAEGSTALIWACHKGHAEVARVLIAAGAALNLTGGYSVTGLCWASLGGHLDVVRVLLAAGADTELGSSSPLWWASSDGYLEIVRALLDAGAEVNDRRLGGTPLACTSNFAVSALLISRGGVR